MTTAASNESQYDVAIIGGGPGGSTVGGLLKKYAPQLRVLILEREKFPREHIGESQLPDISPVLAELGCWEQVEAANFPIKIGATYRWGQSRQLWDFEFLPLRDFKDEPRPAKFQGQRMQTAFQVERAIYDNILLRHAETLGCEVREENQVLDIGREEDRVTSLKLGSAETITARHYVDASGNVAILRRALGVPVDCPTRLKNIAIWDYWTNAAWAVEIGVGGTRIQIMSQPFGWLWFIPLGPTRTSIGLILPVEHYKRTGKSPADLYYPAVHGDERIGKLVSGAACEGTVRTTTDWSFLAERTVGENWLLVGESAGFADPILSAGLTLTQVGAREAAYTLLALDEGKHDPAWLKRHYDLNQRRRIRQHIRFADFWYAANGQFTDLQEHCKDIAAEAGLQMTAGQAWAWIAQGGFTNDVLGQAGIGGLALTGVKHVMQLLTGEPAEWQVNHYNVFTMNLEGATREFLPKYEQGRVKPITCYVRDGRHLPVVGMYEVLVKVLERTGDAATILNHLLSLCRAQLPPEHVRTGLNHALQALEVMVSEGWVKGTFDALRPRMKIFFPEERMIHPNRDPIPTTA